MSYSGLKIVNKKGRILSITHEQDVDGLFCGAILKNAFPDTLVFLTNHGHENMKKVAEVIKYNVNRSSKSGTIVVSDFAHIVDFRLPEVNTLPPLPEIITFYRSLPDSYKKLQLIITKASKGVFWDEELQQDYEQQYVPLKESAISFAIKSLSICEINAITVAI